MIKIASKIYDLATEGMRKTSEDCRRATASGLKEAGFYLRKQIKVAGQTGPSSLGWPKQHPYTRRLRKAHERGGKIKYIYAGSKWKGPKGQKVRQRRYLLERGVIQAEGANPLLRMVSAVRYRMNQQQTRVSIGFLTPGIARIAAKQAAGYQIPVSPRSRRFLFAVGFPLSKGTGSLRVPPRPLIEPVYHREQLSIARIFDRRYHEKLLQLREQTSPARLAA